VIGLLTQEALLDRLVDDPALTLTESAALARVALANYFAAALLMPYEPFLEAARQERYDVEILAHRFRVGFEQACHRLTTLRRTGREGVPFHLIRIDVAGNISKRFSASGITFARYSGACPRWNVFSALLAPGEIRTQISRMPDGRTYFCIARTVRKGDRGWRASPTIHAIGLGCDVGHAKELVYADGIDLKTAEATAVPIGVTCRLCERTDCEQRAMPRVGSPLRVDGDVRGIAFYASTD
jgi:predicted transcriptional regulator